MLSPAVFHTRFSRGGQGKRPMTPAELILDSESSPSAQGERPMMPTDSFAQMVDNSRSIPGWFASRPRVNPRTIWPRILFLSVVYPLLCSIFLISSASAYDGPVGVTFRAPLVEKGAGIDAIRLEGIAVRVKVRIDKAWSTEFDGKDRAFPTGFVPTVADSEMTFTLSNQSGHKIKANVVIPFDASETSGTGFRQPLTISVSLDGKPAKVSKGPELPRGMMKVRSYRVPVEFPAGASMELKVAASHPLAVNPAWFQFFCINPRGRMPGCQSLTPNGCTLDFEFGSTDRELKAEGFECRFKRASQPETLMEKSEKIGFTAAAVEWVRVSR